MNKKRMLGAIITIAFVGIGIYFLFKNIELKKVEDEYQDYTPQEEISDENSQQTKIILYFKNENDELEKEIRKQKEIPNTDLKNIIKMSCKSLVFAIVFIAFFIFFHINFLSLFIKHKKLLYPLAYTHQTFVMIIQYFGII